MELSDSTVPVREGRWTSLWAVALVSLVVQLWLCQFFSLGEVVPASIDVNPSNLWKLSYHFPPTGTFQILNWLGVPYSANPLDPLSLAADHLATWVFFTAYVPVISTLALLAMAAFLRELELSRPAALFGGIIFAWQGDILSFIYPGHYGYMTSWPFFAIAAWAALRAERTGRWIYPVISGAGCGTMVGLLTNADRGAIASMLIGILYLAAVIRRRSGSTPAIHEQLTRLGHLALCVFVAGLIALAPLWATYQSSIQDVKLAGTVNPQQIYAFNTQYSIGPLETLTYLVPGFYGWHSNSASGPYWGWVGEWPGWERTHQGSRNMDLAMSTTGTVAAVLALMGFGLLLPGNIFGPSRLTSRQRYYGIVLLIAGSITLVLAWGWHTALYHYVLMVPLMDKWRDPLKWLEMTNFALVTLGAMGMQHLLASLDASTPQGKVVRRRIALYTMVVLCGLILLLAATYPLAMGLAIILTKEGFEAVDVANMMGTMHTSVLMALIIAAGLCIIVRILWQPGSLRGMTLPNPWLHRLWHRMLEPQHLPATLALGLALLAALQLAWVATKFIEPLPLAALTSSNPLLEALRSEGDEVRCSVAATDPVLNQLLQNQFAKMRISCLDISAASRIPDRLNTYFNALQKDQARLWLLAGVKNVAVPEDSLAEMRNDPAIAANIDKASGYTLMPTGSPDLPSHALVEMKDYLAKATFVPRTESFSNDEDLLKRLVDPAWNPRETLLLTGAPFQPTASSGASSGPDTAEVKTYTPRKIEIKAHSKNGGYVLINDQYDADWQVQVNDQDVDMLRADYIMRAVPVGPGDSSITMHYVEHYRYGHVDSATRNDRFPKALYVNLLSDGTMLAAWLLAGVVLWRRNPDADPLPTS